MDKKKILHIEDQAMFSEALAAKLADQFVLTLVQTEAELAAVLAQSFDLILLDVVLAKRQNALVFMNLLVATKAPVIVLSGEATPADQRALSRLGARAFIPKSCQVGELLRAMQAVLDGYTHFLPEFMAAIGGKCGKELPYLTQRREEVLGKLVERPGISNKAIAGELNLSLDWIKTLISGLLHDFGVSGRAALVEEARERGFLPQRELLGA